MHVVMSQLMLPLCLSAQDNAAMRSLSTVDLVALLEKRERAIEDISGEYTLDESATDEAISSYANAVGKSRESQRNHFDSHSSHIFALRASHGVPKELWYEHSIKNGELSRHNLFAFDGEKHYTIRDIPAPDEPSVANVTIGADIRNDFGRECMYVLVMGLFVPEGEGPLSRQARNATMSAAHDDSRRTMVDMTFRIPSQGKDQATRVASHFSITPWKLAFIRTGFDA